MNLVVFGATGPTGRLVIEHALAAGHEVTAVARNPGALPVIVERLRVLQGDVLEGASVARAVAGQDAVISTIGVPYRPLRPITLYSRGTRAILDAMQVHDVARLAVVSSGGTDPHRDPEAPFLWERVIKPIVGGTLYADMTRMEHLLSGSDRNWTIARPAALVDQQGSDNYRAEPGYIVPGIYTTARADLAEFLVRAVEEERFPREAVAVVSPGLPAPQMPAPSGLLVGASATALLAAALLLRRATRDRQATERR